MRRIVLATICALDVAVGDPSWLPHPVRAIGAAVVAGEKLLRKRIRADDRRAEALAGALLTVGIAVAASLGAACARRFAGTVAVVVLGAASLASRSLDDAIAAVERDLRSGDLSRARTELAMIVGRDTGDLDESEIARAALEAAAESLCDGIIAPLAALRCGGIATAWGFKAISTLDSMLGHIEPPYTHFGRVAARLDDLANFIPARLTVALIVLAAAVFGEDARAAITLARRDGPKHRSPNAGWCEAALAGALHRRLGGSNRYDGRIVAGPYLGAEYAAPNLGDIARGRRIVAAAAAFGMLLAIGSAPW